MRNLDSDQDGLSDYHEVYKYNLDPMSADTDKDGILDSAESERREKAGYTIKISSRINQIADLSTMQDDYQDVKLIKQEGDSVWVEIILYLETKNGTGLIGNPNWRSEYAKMPEVQPTLTANYDDELRKQILEDLKKDGIVLTDSMTDLDVVTRVAPWIWKTSRVVNANGAPMDFFYWYNDNEKRFELHPKYSVSQLRSYMKEPSWSIDDYLKNMVIGKTMYQNKVHGSCSSSATYQATVLKALGIPTRITFQLPMAIPGIPSQKAFILNTTKKQIVKDFYVNSDGFCDHYYNEVYINHEWVRLNYDKLGANIFNPNMAFERAGALGIMVNMGVKNDYMDFKSYGIIAGMALTPARTLSENTAIIWTTSFDEKE